MRIMPGGALESDQELSGPSSVFVGQKLDEHRGAFILEYPMDKGAVVEDRWDAMEKIWDVSSFIAPSLDVMTVFLTLFRSRTLVHVFQSQCSS